MHQSFLQKIKAGEKTAVILMGQTAQCVTQSGFSGYAVLYNIR